MADYLEAPPALSTPATHVFDDDGGPAELLPDSLCAPEQIHIRYEIERTVAEIKQGKWKRVALQFPDGMLPDAPTVFECLRRRLKASQGPNTNLTDTYEASCPDTLQQSVGSVDDAGSQKLFILADTSYGACCVDEIAAEHVSADVVVHYGRACLSPTARLPVIHVFTHQPLAVEMVIESFKATYPNHGQLIILMSDVIYASHLQHIGMVLRAQGYASLFTTNIVHDPSSPLPNRTVPDSVYRDPIKLGEWQLFHISDPPDSLLLTLASRVSDIHVYPTKTATTLKSRQSLSCLPELLCVDATLF